MNWTPRSGLFTEDRLLTDIGNGRARISRTENSSGSSVERIQWALVSWGSAGVLPNYGPDGDYGSETIAAVKKFKRDALRLPTPAITEEVDAQTVQGLDQLRFEFERSINWFSEAAGVQNALNQLDLGLAQLKVDSVVGPKTSEAIGTYQLRLGLPQTGAIDHTLLNSMFTGAIVTGQVSLRSTILPFLWGGEPDLPLASNPMDEQWYAALRKWIMWANQDFPKDAAPPYPVGLPPSLSLPVLPALATPPFIRQQQTVGPHLLHPEAPPKVSLTHRPTFEVGQTLKLSLKPDGPKIAKAGLEYETSIAVINTIGQKPLVESTLALSLSNERVAVDHTVKVVPFKLTAGSEQLGLSLKALLATTVGTQPVAEGFAGFEGSVKWAPLQGMTLSVGPKLGTMIEMSYTGGTNLAVSSYPLKLTVPLELVFTWD